jgi:hypothetical protein
MESQFRSAVEKKTARAGRRRALHFVRHSKQGSEPLDCWFSTMERFSCVSHSFIRIHPEDGEEEVSLVPEGAIDAAFSQAGDAHQIVERSGRISPVPELIAHGCEYLVLVELSGPRHVTPTMPAENKNTRKILTDQSVTL